MNIQRELNESGLWEEWLPRQVVSDDVKNERKEWARKLSRQFKRKREVFVRNYYCPGCETTFSLVSVFASLRRYGVCEMCRLWEKNKDKPETYVTLAYSKDQEKRPFGEFYKKTSIPTLEEILALPPEKLTPLHARVLQRAFRENN